MTQKNLETIGILIGILAGIMVIKREFYPTIVQAKCL